MASLELGSGGPREDPLGVVRGCPHGPWHVARVMGSRWPQVEAGKGFQGSIKKEGL